MDLNELKELIELIAEKGFAEFELERQGLRLRISRSSRQAGPAAQTPQVSLSPVAVSEAAATEPGSQLIAAAPAQSVASSQTSEPNPELHIIKSPIVGTFYRAASPTSEPFVRIGDSVEYETVVCIIEAMKLMNEIHAEVTGEVAKIFVENGQAVEFGQPLFGIKVQ